MKPLSAIEMHTVGSLSYPGTEHRISVRFPMLETLALLLILIVGIAAVIGISVLTSRMEQDDGSSQPGSSPRVLTATEAAAVVEQSLSLHQTVTSATPSIPPAPQQPAAEWIRRLQSDPDALGTFVLRTTTAPAYIRQVKDDEAFTKDAWALLAAAGSPLAADPSGPSIPVWTDQQSRVTWLRAALQAAGFSAGDLDRIPAASGKLVSLELSDLVPTAGSTVFGRREIAGTIKTSQDTTNLAESLATRQSLMLDGRVYSSNPTATAQEANMPFSMMLDFRGQLPGQHQAEVFVLASDGRSAYQNVGSLQVPVMTAIPAGGVVKQTLPASGQAQYAVIPAVKTASGWHYTVTAVNMDGPIATELYSLDGKQIASSNNRETQWEGLRANVPADAEADHARATAIPEEDRIAYARIIRSGPDTPAPKAIQYTLVQSDSIAVSKSKPEQYYAILERRDDGLTLQGADGQRIAKKESEVRLVEFAARLSELTITSVEGTTTVFPMFDTETDVYGLYLPAGSGSLSFQVSAREGSFAELTVTHESDSADTRALKLTDTLFPEPSDNILRISLKNGDGTKRTYRVHILLTPQKDGYHQVLEAFPLSYRSPLYLLHVLHPAYEFTADQTNLTFAEFLDAQTYKDRSLVDSASSPASWVLPGSPVYDGKYWKAATRKVVAHYGDPRNFLNQQDIFQFETLRFQTATHTRAAVEKILAGTFMAAGHEKNPDNIDYASLILTAGEQANLSPLFIAAKIIQEMGRNGASPLAFGKLAGYEGAYNFYNIGSTPNTAVANGAQINGALYALYGRTPAEKQITPDEEVYLLPWKTPERAITGGAIWIASRYIAIGQDTLYLQKFDLVAEDGLYIHQYATNIQMAYAEGRRTYSAYKDMNLLDAGFAFRIPVFLDMPEAWSPLPA